MYEHLEINNLIAPHQFGVWCNRSTQQCTITLMNIIRMNVDEGKCMAALCMDLRKFVDFGILNTELEWSTYYPFHWKLQVKIEGYVSDAQSITCRVPQGSILVPLLLLSLINDLPSTIKLFQIMLCAEDAVLYYAHQTPEQELNAKANRVADWLINQVSH